MGNSKGTGRSDWYAVKESRSLYSCFIERIAFRLVEITTCGQDFVVAIIQSWKF